MKFGLASPASLLCCGLLAVAPLGAQSVARPQAPSSASQPLDQEYTDQIREHTTDAFFATPYVDHLPASDAVPTPLDVLGHIAGAPDVLSYSEEVHRYMRAVADASPRVQVFPAGTSEEGREMILVVVSSEDTMRDLERYKQLNARLADPRGLADDAARELVATGKPMYWATGAMHSPETGSPEMLMELVYRLAVEETPFVQAIRDGLICMVTPIIEVDGRDKRVDLLKLRQAEQEVPRLIFWGKYVAHDNNRDGIGLGLELSRMLMRTFLEYHPQVMHDLHESASHLYTSTGSGPYNAWIDPILVDEWHILAYQEVGEMTKFGVPGVWTHQFYDGWAPNYAFYAANGHNAIGRFYETQGAGDANTRRISTRSTREWYRPNPPLPSTMWSIRNNVNMQQSALLIAMNYVAQNKEKFLENFLLKTRRSIQKPWNEGPAAYVFPASDPRPGQAAELLRLLQRQGCEVQRTVRDATVGELAIPAGSWVVRMDQPYSRMADMLLDRAYYNVEDSRPYDDTGWTLGPLFNAEVVRVEDTAVLGVFMEPVESEVRVSGGTAPLGHGQPVAYLVPYHAEVALASFRFAHPELTMSAAEEAFESGGTAFPAGSLVIPAEGNAADLGEVLNEAGGSFGFTAYATTALPVVATHPLGVPRVAVLHTWTSTQNEGWLRMALDHSGIPYEYISVHDVRDDANLRGRFDVIVFGPSSSDALSIVSGLPMQGEPVAWSASEVAPNIGRVDETDDMRGGLELEGVLHLHDFVEAGGAFLAIQSSCSLPIHFGLARGVSIDEPEDLRVAGSVLLTEVTDATSPIRYGYGDTLGVYFRESPVLAMGRGRGFSRFRGGGAGGGSAEDRLLAGTARGTGRGTLEDPDRPQGRPQDQGRAEPDGDESAPGRDGRRAGGGEGRGERRPAADAARTILRFHAQHEQLLLSGMLAGGDELAGKPAVIDCPLGEGHVVLFAINPTWRQETYGSLPLLLNSILHYDHLSAGTARPERQRPEAIPAAGSDD